MNEYPYLNDKTFLKKMDKSLITSYTVKIIALNWDEDPIEEIQGKVKTANFTIDGSSSMRRTGNLTLIADQTTKRIENVNQLISMNKKIKVEIGKNNTTNSYPQYPIVWYPLGIYIIISANITHSTSDMTISLQLKDKMCLLNGQCGGVIPAATILHQISSIDENGKEIILPATMYQIIQQVVTHFGNEQLGKVIISDLETQVKQVVQWNKDIPLYIVQKGTNQYALTTSEKQYIKLLNKDWFDVLGSPFSYGNDIGYVYTDFTYPGNEFIANAGDTVTSILDKIVQVLGNYEYFYDLDGNFIFQQIKNYLNNTQLTYIEDPSQKNISMQNYLLHIYENGAPDPQDYMLDYSNGKTVYDFEDSTLISSYSNNPQYAAIKNDFVVWGMRENSQVKVPIRYHLAIDKKPQVGNTYRVFPYLDPEDNLLKYHAPLIYNSRSDFPEQGSFGVYYYSIANVQTYYWSGNTNNGYNGYIPLDITLINVTTRDWRTQLYLSGEMAAPLGEATNYYYAELANEWPKLFELREDENNPGYYYDVLKPSVVNHPENVNYFLDIIDSGSTMGEYSVENIGRRSQVISNNDGINCIFETEVPDLIYLPTSTSIYSTATLEQQRQLAIDRGQAFTQLADNIYSNLSPGGFLNSAYENIRQALHEYTSYKENVSITCIPIYYLQPNTRISINDPDSEISGDYMINSISFSLDTNNTMNISATRAIERI